jgi:KamA family protein
LIVKFSDEVQKYQAVTRENIRKLPVWERLGPELQEVTDVVSSVLPFRTNKYVIDELIDWDRVPNDPMYQLTFPQKGMLGSEQYARMASLIRSEAPRDEIKKAANEFRMQLKPHPAGQMTHNRPKLDGELLEGMQHKYRETVLFFPSQGQTCHAYCTFCFRWAQFVGMSGLKFASREVDKLVAYLKEHKEVTDVLFTGGDPMVMKASVLAAYIEPLLTPELDHIKNIRIGTKSVAYWPQRFVSDPDADEVLRIFDRVVASGRHLALMGHYNHPVEISTGVSREAIRRIRTTGANVRMQSPVIRHVNDDSNVWADLWSTGVNLGMIPYYMFVERDTGARQYFELPLMRVWEIYREAYNQVSGLGRSVRGPSMSAFPGKVRILGVTQVESDPVFILEYLQARQPELVRIPFFAKFDPDATWFDQLEPASDNDRPFFEERPAQVLEDLTGFTT